MTYAMPFQKYVKTVLRVAASSAARKEQLKNPRQIRAYATNLPGMLAGIEILLPGRRGVGPYNVHAGLRLFFCSEPVRRSPRGGLRYLIRI